MVMRKEGIWMLSSFLASVEDVTEFHIIETYSSLILTSVKFNVNKQSGVLKEKVIVRCKPNILRIGRKYSLHVRENAVRNQFVFQGLWRCPYGLYWNQMFCNAVESIGFPGEGNNPSFAVH
jgi:hypothetical protein